MLKVAVVDSGINAGHSHVGDVAGGLSLVSAEWTDSIGHGTAVAAAIRDHAPDVALYAVKIFDRSFSTQIATVVKALEWCAEHKMDVVNLSLGTAKQAHGELLEQASRKVNILVAPYDFVGLPAFPGSYPWVFGVSSDPTCARDRFCIAGGVRFLASPMPRTIPGLATSQNFAGPSFAVANFTGLICRAMKETNIGAADDLRQFLLTEQTNSKA